MVCCREEGDSKLMHFYDWNIGEYAKKTQHLTNEEDLAYRRALDLYYDTEKPLLTDGLATLSRRLRVDEQSLKNVLDEFFPGGVNKHAEEKIEAYYAYINKQKANGKLGGRPKRTQAKPTAKPKEPGAKPTLTTNHEPLTSIKSKAIASSDAGKPDCPHKEIIALYHQILPSCPAVKDWTPARASTLKARWSESADRQSLEYWRDLFGYIAGIPFLTGRVSSGGRKPFFASLSWIVKAENFAKIREGNYE